jgi:hypothetical protein
MKVEDFKKDDRFKSDVGDKINDYESYTNIPFIKYNEEDGYFVSTYFDNDEELSKFAYLELELFIEVYKKYIESEYKAIDYNDYIAKRYNVNLSQAITCVDWDNYIMKGKLC